MDQTVPGHKPSRIRLATVAVVVLVVVAIWSGLWWLAANRATAAFEAWKQAEAAHGRQWTCPNQHIGGYPVALKLRCDQATYHGEVAGRVVSGIVQGLVAAVRLDHPTVLTLDAKSPMNLRADDDEFDLMVAWQGLSLSLGGLPREPRSGSLDTTRLAVTLSVAGQGDFNARAAHLAGHAEPATTPQAGAGDEHFVFAATDITLPTVDVSIGGNDPIEGSGEGVLTHADLLSAPSVARLEAWRLAGGRLDVAALALAKGAFHGQAQGRLALDDQHRMAGRLETTLAGYGPIAERFGIPIAGVQLGGLLSNLLSGKQPQAADAGDTVHLSVKLTDGAALLGPFKLPVRLDPIY